MEDYSLFVGEIYSLSQNRDMFSTTLNEHVPCKQGDLFIVVDKRSEDRIEYSREYVTLIHPSNGLITISYYVEDNDWINLRNTRYDYGILIHVK